MVHIGDKTVGSGHAPFIIAEMSGNHNQSLERALRIVDEVAAAGAHALKIQTYTADTITMDGSGPEFRITDMKSPWAGRSLHDLYAEAQTPWEWHRPIFDRARVLGMIPFSTPFDQTAVDLLEDLEAPCYKIASFENVDLPLIRAVARTGKPLIISTGLATIAELDEAVRVARDAGSGPLILLKCTSTYPAASRDSNLRTIPHLRELFGCEVGLSDHTPGIGVAVAAVALGASVVEKHVTLDRSEGGLDSTFSLDPRELRLLVTETERAWESLGSVRYGPTSAEEGSLQFRRSIYVVRKVTKGEAFTAENCRIIRPGLGLEPRFYESVLGRRASGTIAAGTPFDWSMT